MSKSSVSVKGNGIVWWRKNCALFHLWTQFIYSLPFVYENAKFLICAVRGSVGLVSRLTQKSLSAFDGISLRSYFSLLWLWLISSQVILWNSAVRKLPALILASSRLCYRKQRLPQSISCAELCNSLLSKITSILLVW